MAYRHIWLKFGLHTQFFKDEDATEHDDCKTSAILSGLNVLITLGQTARRLLGPMIQSAAFLEGPVQKTLVQMCASLKYRNALPNITGPGCGHNIK